MASKDEIAAAIQSVDERIAGLQERLLSQETQALPSGEWRVRDALSHLAARANGVPRVVQRAERSADATAGGGAAPAFGNIDEINAGQVSERSDRSAVELLDEISSGHAAAVRDLNDVDEALLAREIPLGFRPGDTTVGEMMVMGGPGHDNRHLDDIEAALSG